jgi:prolyl oligopeptidase PreP (S9A serine peptidase family)
MANKVNKIQAKKTNSIIIGGQKHTVAKATNGDIVVNHPGSKKTTFKKIDLTKKADVKTVAAGIAAVKKYHKTHPVKGK